MSTEEQLKALADNLKSQILGDAKEFMNEVKDEDEEFFGDIAKRIAENFLEMQLGSDDRKEVAKENLESLERASKSRIASRAMDVVAHGNDQIASIVQSVIKTAMTIGLALI
jgi:hypothetical protein